MGGTWLSQATPTMQAQRQHQVPAPKRCQGELHEAYQNDRVLGLGMGYAFTAGTIRCDDGGVVLKTRLSPDSLEAESLFFQSMVPRKHRGQASRPGPLELGPSPPVLVCIRSINGKRRLGHQF